MINYNINKKILILVYLYFKISIHSLSFILFISIIIVKTIEDYYLQKFLFLFTIFIPWMLKLGIFVINSIILSNKPSYQVWLNLWIFG